MTDWRHTAPADPASRQRPPDRPADHPRQAPHPVSERTHSIKTWRTPTEPPCCPRRAEQLAKAIHVLQAREVAR